MSSTNLNLDSNLVPSTESHPSTATRKKRTNARVGFHQEDDDGNNNNNNNNDTFDQNDDHLLHDVKSMIANQNDNDDDDDDTTTAMVTGESSSLKGTIINNTHNNNPEFSSLDNTMGSINDDEATKLIMKRMMEEAEQNVNDQLDETMPGRRGGGGAANINNKTKNGDEKDGGGGDSTGNSKTAQRIRLSIDDLRDIKVVCDEFDEIELDDFICHVGPIVRRQNSKITDRDLELLFEFIDANDSKGVDWDEISMFLIRNDEMEEKRLNAMEVTKFGMVERSTHATLPRFDTQLRMLHHKHPITKVVMHPRLPLSFSASHREVKIWKTDQLRHIRTPLVSTKHDLVTSISHCPVWDDALLVTAYDHSISLFSSQSGDLSQIFVSERGGSKMGRRADRSGTGKRTVQREVFSVPWTEQEARQLRSDLGGKAALCGTISSHDPLLGHLNPPKTEEATVLYDLCYVNPKAAALLPPQNSRRSAFPTCADVFISPMTSTHKLAVGLSTGHAQFYDVESCRRVDGTTPVGLRCESIVKMHEGSVRTLKYSQSLGALISGGGEDGLIQVRNLERVDLTVPTCTLGQGIPILDSRYAGAINNSKFTLHERDTSRFGHAHGILNVDIHEKHRLLLSCAQSENDALLWSPFIVKPLAKLECSKKSLAIDVSFNQNEPHATVLTDDGQIRIFDIRTLRCLQQFDASVIQNKTSSNQSSMDAAFPTEETQRPSVICVDHQRCRVMTGTSEIYAHEVISSDRKDLVEGHNSAILGGSVVNRSNLNFLMTFDNKDVCLWDNNASLVVRWNQSAASSSGSNSNKDNSKSGESKEGGDNSNTVTSAAAAQAANLDAGLTGAVASSNKKAELCCGCMDTNERRLFMATTDGRVDVVNMMNGYPLKKLSPPDGLELDRLKKKREQEERDLALQMMSEQHQGQDGDQQQQQANLNSLSPSKSPARDDGENNNNSAQTKKKMMTLESVTHQEHNIDKNQKHSAKELERRDRLGLADNTASRSLLSEADKIRAARKALGEVTAIDYGDQKIPRESGLCAVTYSSGYAALYVDEESAPSNPQRILRANEPIYSVAVFPPSFVAIGLAGRIAIHTLEEVGDRLTYLEPLSREQLIHSSLHAAIVPGPLLNDPRNSSTLNLLHPVESSSAGNNNMLGSRSQSSGMMLHNSNSNNNNRSKSNLMSTANLNQYRSTLTSAGTTVTNAGAGGLGGTMTAVSDANPSSHNGTFYSRDSRMNSRRNLLGNNTSSNNNSKLNNNTSNATSLLTSTHHHQQHQFNNNDNNNQQDNGLAKFSQDRQQMMSIVEVMACVHVNRSEPTLLSGTGAGTLHVWDIRRQIEAQRFLATVSFGEAVTALALNPSTHDQLAVGDSCGYVTVFDISTLGARELVDIGAKSVLLSSSVREQFKVLSRFRAHDSSVCSLALGSAGYVVSAASDTVALRFSLDGTFLRVFGRYFGKEGFSSPTSWLGLHHHSAALATFDAVRARVLAKIIDAVGPQTKEQLYAQCYYVNGNKKVEAEYSAKELDEVNRRIRKDENNRVVYRQPPPKSPFFSRLYYEDSSHEVMIDRLLRCMLEQIPFTGSTSLPTSSESSNNLVNDILGKNKLPLGKMTTTTANRVIAPTTTSNLDSHNNNSNAPLMPPKLSFNKDNNTFFRTPKHGNNSSANQQHGSIKKSVVEFSLPSPAEEHHQQPSSRTSSKAKLHQQQQNATTNEEDDNNKTNNTFVLDAHSFDSNQNFVESQPLDDDTHNINNTTNTADENNNNKNTAPGTSSPLSAGSFSTKRNKRGHHQSSGASTGIGSPLGSSAKDRSLFDMKSMVQQSGFFEESDEDDGPIRRPVPPKHVTKLRKPTDVGTLAHSLLMASPERFMTLAPLTEEQQQQQNREKLLFGSERAKRTYETANNECIKIASEIIDEQQKVEVIKQKKRLWKLQQIEQHRKLKNRRRGSSVSSATSNLSSVDASTIDDEAGFSDFSGDDNDNIEDQQQQNDDDNNTKPRQNFTVPTLPLGAQTARVGGTSSSSNKRDSKNKNKNKSLLARGEGLEIASEWKHFLEFDDKNTMTHGVTPRNVWMRDTVRTKPKEMLAYRGLAGAFDMNLHLKEEKRQEMMRRRELGLRGGDGGGSDNSGDDGDTNNMSVSRASMKSLSPLRRGMSKRGSMVFGGGNSSAGGKSSLTPRSTHNLFRSFRRHNFGSHLLDGSDHRLNKRNPLDGPSGGVVFTEQVTKREKLYDAPSQKDDGNNENKKQEENEEDKQEKEKETTSTSTVKIPHKPTLSRDEKQPTVQEKTEQEEDLEIKSNNGDDYEGTSNNNNQEKEKPKAVLILESNNSNDDPSSMDPTEAYILSQTGGERIRLAFPKLSRLLLEAQQLKEEQEEELRLEKEKAEKELDRRARRANRRARAASGGAAIVDGTRDDLDDETYATSTSGATSDFGDTSGSEYTSGHGEDFSDLDSEDSNEKKFFENAMGENGSEILDDVAERRRRRRLRKKRAQERKRRREKAEEDSLHYSKDGWSAKIRQLRDGELRIQATQPGSEIPAEAFFPPKDNAHVLANILSKWHVEKVEKEKPPAAGLQGVSAAVLSGSSNAGGRLHGGGSESGGMSAQQQHALRGRRVLDEKEIIRDWSKMNREGIPRGGATK